MARNVRRTEVVAGRVFHSRVFARSRGIVQSINGAAPGSVGRCARLITFLLSLRATAEGHVSSIAFRSGMLDADSNITMDVPSRYSLEPMQVPNSKIEKPLFERKLQELRLMGDFNREVLNGLPVNSRWSNSAPASVAPQNSFRGRAAGDEEQTLMLARSNYEVVFAPRVGFVRAGFVPRHSFTEQRDRGCSLRPISIRRRHAYLVRDLHGVRRRMILPQFLETSDFLRFKFITLNGPAVENKGMALFPQKSRAFMRCLAGRTRRIST